MAQSILNKFHTVSISLSHTFQVFSLAPIFHKEYTVSADNVLSATIPMLCMQHVQEARCSRAKLCMLHHSLHSM